MVREAGTVRWQDLYQNSRSGGWRGGSSEEHALAALAEGPRFGSQRLTTVYPCSYNLPSSELAETVYTL